MQRPSTRFLFSRSLHLLVALAVLLILLPIGVTHAASLIVINTNDGGAGSLRQAIADAGPGDTISFSLPDHSTITLASELVVAKNLTISGPGAAHLTISGNNAVRVLQVNGGTLLLDGVTITAGSNAGGQGGGIYIDNGTSGLTLTNSVVSGNSAASGGGIFIWHGGTLTVLNSTISGNNATDTGGGIYTQNAITTVTNSTINDNSGNPGGGILNTGNPEYAVLTVTNSTISGNTTSVYGAALANVYGVLIVTDSTISNSHAGLYDGVIYSNYPAPTLKNTILDNPSVKNCISQLVITDGGGNVSNDGTCLFTAASSRSNVSSQLGPLADNGGSTFTHALLNGSPAIDLIDASACAVTTDQRGAPRPQGAACDSGAFEYGSQVPTVTPTNTAVPPTNTPTASATATVASTPTQTATATRTATVTNSPTASSTPSNTALPTNTATATRTATSSPIPSNTALPTNTPTNAATATRTATVANSPTASSTPSNTALPTNTPTNAATATRTATSSPIPSNTALPTNTPTNAATATRTATVANSPTASRTASATQTTPTSTTAPPHSPTPTETPIASATSTSTPTRTPTGGSAEITVVASADSYVQKNDPKQNFGSKKALIVDGIDDPREVYVRFSISGVTQSIQKVVLRLYVTDGAKDGPKLYGAANTTWSESTLIWNNRPGATGPVLGNLGKVNDKVWVEYDVTALVTGNGTYSFVLVGDSTESVEFASRESSNKPQLVLSVQPQ